MPETIVVNLSSRVEAFRFLTAEWWEEDSKFVVVRGSMRKDSEDFALRLDLDKRAFLDHVPNEKMEKLLRRQAEHISQLVWGERLKRSKR